MTTSKADYNFKFRVKEGVKFLLITDENLGNVSVTNDIENVIKQIRQHIVFDLESTIILYADSEGKWDGWNNQYQLFFPVGGTTENDAMFNYLRIKKLGE